MVESTSGAVANIAQVVNANTLKLSSVTGLLDTGDVIVELSTNTHATVNSIYSANGTTLVSNTWLSRFNQTMRVPLSTNTVAFSPYESVVQDVSNAIGTVYKTSDIDVSYVTSNGTFSPGNTIRNDGDPSSNAIVLTANTTYLRLVNVQGTWNVGNRLINNLNVGANTAVVYPVLSLVDVDGRFQAGDNDITGQTSGARGRSRSANTMVYPDLERNSGEVLYVDNLVPFTRGANTHEVFRLVLKF